MKRSDVTLLRVAAQMLEVAIDQFENHGSNDYGMDNTPEHYAFIAKMIAKGDSPNEAVDVSPDKTTINTSDVEVMRYCVRELRQIAERLDKIKPV